MLHHGVLRLDDLPRKITEGTRFVLLHRWRHELVDLGGVMAMTVGFRSGEGEVL
jgi:hypothetical protein